MDRANGGPAPLRWLSEGACPTPAQQIVFQEYVRAVSEHHERLQRLEHELHEQVKAWRLSPVVEALQALRGVQFTVAVTLVAEMGDLTRVESPRELMKFLGLIPFGRFFWRPTPTGVDYQSRPLPCRRVLVEGA